MTTLLTVWCVWFAYSARSGLSERNIYGMSSL